MKALDRREKIIDILRNSDQAKSGTNLANELNVSRQLIVGDIALLRASGKDIISTPKGYILNNNSEDGYIVKTIACKHSKDLIEDELNLIVDEGSTIVNVIVEHSVYGQLTGDLHISSRRDVKDFMKKLNLVDINPLAELTDGVHLHTIKVKSEEAFEEVIKILKEKGYLY
ncbi:MAG: transcription repressor NadR [Romboutsia sp.]|uniref:transcription repressor NadR n=1 Tax=Romboutsia sp. TaxID=1965302 RepID=UPI003F3ACC9E